MSGNNRANEQYETTAKFRSGTPSAIASVFCGDGKVYAGSAHGEVFVWDQFVSDAPACARAKKRKRKERGRGFVRLCM